MAFIVEDGTGLDNATSYNTVAQADDYASSFVVGTTDWDALTQPEKEKYLMVAARFLDGMMGWTSQVKTPTQSRAWPRRLFLDREGRRVSDDKVPQAIKDAQVELAVSSVNTPLTTEVEKLIREDFGDTSDVYAAPVSIGGNDIVRSLLKSLAFLGYGRSKATTVNIERA